MILSFQWWGCCCEFVRVLLRQNCHCNLWPSVSMLEFRGGEGGRGEGREAARKTVAMWWCVCVISWCRVLPCLGEMRRTYVLLEPRGWHWRWGKTELQGKCFPWSEAATVYTALSIDTSPVDPRTLGFTHKRKGRLTKRSLPTHSQDCEENRTYAALKVDHFIRLAWRSCIITHVILHSPAAALVAVTVLNWAEVARPENAKDYTSQCK